MPEIKMESEKPRVNALREWGLDMDVFRAKAKTSLGEARIDVNEIKKVLQQTLAETREILSALQTSTKPAAAELKLAFERAWNEIERGFARAKEKNREAQLPPRPDDSYWNG